MAENKTRQTDSSVADFLAAVPDAQKREDSQVLIRIMREISGEEPKMWGPSIIGFGSYHYKYESGREGDMPVLGFSPRKQALVLYMVPGFDTTDHAAKLGTYKTGKSCLYIRRLTDVDITVLRKMIEDSFNHMKENTTDGTYSGHLGYQTR
ncbi:MAG: hypothetical protein TR69_WS6001000395 [candidate division WS6 bacterium OLB20]|uniref:YdhG-like domain-containing protein n=1 Tax=candidate division WS6 bacterium OLB20 TaxID=1617426 RepID=A0A136LXL2_9BACT|nr:MAG: hypothetical protein TR69_WS6001000395 [candidate division WS6 bacterium OLB20]